MDRQTDEHYCGITALCEASHGKNGETKYMYRRYCRYRRYCKL